MKSKVLQSDIQRDECMLTGKFGGRGYDWWWHSFTGYSRETGKEKSFFIAFFLCNPDRGERKPVFKPRPSYLMVKAGAWGKDGAQLHRFFGWDELTLKGKAPFAVAAEDCYLSETATKGRINVSAEDAEAHPEYMCQSGRMSWKLKIEKKIPFNVGYGAGKLFRELKAFQMYWHAEGMKTLYSGTVTWNGEVYDVKPETCWGYADKNWGSDFTMPWVWSFAVCEIFIGSFFRCPAALLKGPSAFGKENRSTVFNRKFFLLCICAEDEKNL